MQKTNMLFLADCLPDFYPLFFKGFSNALKKAQIPFQFLPGTKDVWVKDFMPVQVSRSRFVQFRYEPDYLVNSVKGRKSISDTNIICQKIGIKSIKFGINLDGGNITRTANQVVVSDKIFDENQNIEGKQLLGVLKRHLKVKQVIVIPRHPMDFTGHADGMVRFYKGNTVLVNDYSRESQQFRRTLFMALHNAGLKIILIPYNPYRNLKAQDATGEYINFLLMKQAVLVPVFGLPEDGPVLKLFQKLYPGKKVVPVESNELAVDGGVLNCISWNIHL